MFIFAGVLFMSIVSTQGVPKLRPLTGDVHHVTVNEVKAGKLRVAKAVRECHFPHSLHFTFEVERKTIILHLEKNSYLSQRVPVYVTSKGHSYREGKNASNAFALYQDVLHGSALLITCQEDFSYRLHGSFRHDGILHHMSHSNVSEPSPQHFIQSSLQTNINFDQDTELPAKEDLNERGQMLGSLNEGPPVPDENIIELLFTVDKAFYQRFSDIYGSDEATAAVEQYAAVIANEIDLHFQSVEMVDPSLSIRIYLSGVVIPEVGSDVSWSLESQRVFNGTTYLYKFLVISNVKSWLNGETGLPRHDHLMALSRLDIATIVGNQLYLTSGFATVGGMCSSSGKASITIDGARIAYIAAHELGHTLGASHDVGKCSRGNIMTAVTTKTTNITFSEAQWTFSSCSVESFKSFINGLSCNCMKQHAFTDAEFKQLQKESLPGTVYSLNQQCQMFNRIWSTSCNQTIKEEDCYNGYECSTNSDPERGCKQGDTFYPMAGTPCGAADTNKWCYRGRCIKKGATNCNTEKKCCVKVGKQKKCCKGPKCCNLKQASETKCYKSCCPPEKSTKTSCYQRKCCTKIKVNERLKRECCSKANCCNKKWGKKTKCCLTCRK